VQATSKNKTKMMKIIRMVFLRYWGY